MLCSLTARSIATQSAALGRFGKFTASIRRPDKSSRLKLRLSAARLILRIAARSLASPVTNNTRSFFGTMNLFSHNVPLTSATAKSHMSVVFRDFCLAPTTVAWSQLKTSSTSHSMGCVARLYNSSADLPAKDLMTVGGGPCDSCGGCGCLVSE